MVQTRSMTPKKGSSPKKNVSPVIKATPKLTAIKEKPEKSGKKEPLVVKAEIPSVDEVVPKRILKTPKASTKKVKREPVTECKITPEKQAVSNGNINSSADVKHVSPHQISLSPAKEAIVPKGIFKTPKASTKKRAKKEPSPEPMDESEKTQEKQHNKSSIRSGDDHYVPLNQIASAVDSLKEYLRQWNSNPELQNPNRKRNLLEDDEGFETGAPSEKLFLQIDFKQIPPNRSTYIHSVRVPHPWRTFAQEDVCLIVKDYGQERSKDREYDLTTTRNHFKDAIAAALPGASDTISYILPYLALKTEYKPNEARHKLSRAYDFFLVDRRLISNKYDFLPRFLGASFWRHEKKFPLAIDLTARNLTAELERALGTVQIFITGLGSSTSFPVSNLKQSTQDIADNVSTVLSFVHEKYGDLVESFRLKTSRSIAIPFYADMRPKGGVNWEGRVTIPELQPLTEEFTLAATDGTQVAVYPSGDVKVIDPSLGNKLAAIKDRDDKYEHEWVQGFMREQQADKYRAKRQADRRRMLAKRMFKAKKINQATR